MFCSPLMTSFWGWLPKCLAVIKTKEKRKTWSKEIKRCWKMWGWWKWTSKHFGKLTG